MDLYNIIGFLSSEKTDNIIISVLAVDIFGL